MSFYKSKGLTARCVIISSLVEGFIPNLSEKENSPAEQYHNKLEQRRLFYVTLTRTTETLILSTFSTMKKADAYLMGAKVIRTENNRAVLQSSEFLNELGDMSDIEIFQGKDFSQKISGQ